MAAASVAAGIDLNVINQHILTQVSGDRIRLSGCSIQPERVLATENKKVGDHFSFQTGQKGFAALTGF